MSGRADLHCCLMPPGQPRPSTVFNCMWSQGSRDGEGTHGEGKARHAVLLQFQSKWASACQAGPDS